MASTVRALDDAVAGLRDSAVATGDQSYAATAEMVNILARFLRRKWRDGRGAVGRGAPAVREAASAPSSVA